LPWRRKLDCFRRFRRAMTKFFQRPAGWVAFAFSLTGQEELLVNHSESRCRPVRHFFKSKDPPAAQWPKIHSPFVCQNCGGGPVYRGQGKGGVAAEWRYALREDTSCSCRSRSASKAKAGNSQLDRHTARARRAAPASPPSRHCPPNRPARLNRRPAFFRGSWALGRGDPGIGQVYAADTRRPACLEPRRPSRRLHLPAERRGAGAYGAPNGWGPLRNARGAAGGRDFG